MSEYQTLIHEFDPVFDRRSRILVLGSFPSVKSRAQAFYYGNPQNRFWQVVAAATGAEVPRDDDVDAKRRLLLEHGIALWDVIAQCDIKGSSDASIQRVTPVEIERVTRAAPIRKVLCNGGTAARLYRRYLERRVGLPAIALPSTSPANASWSLDRLVGRWAPELAGGAGGC